MGRLDAAEMVIQDDDPGFVFAATNPVVAETSGTVMVKVQRVGDLGTPGSVAAKGRAAP